MAKALRKSTIEIRRQRVAAILPILKHTYPDAKCALDHSSPLELLVATILSAQCTDARVNIVTRDLFRKYRTARDYADAPAGQLERDIQSTGFFNNKAKSLRGMGAAISQQHKGKVPDTMDELTARELEVYRLIAQGHSNAEIAGALYISDTTVKTHVTRVLQKLGVRDRAQAIVLAYETHVFDSDEH